MSIALLSVRLLVILFSEIIFSFFFVPLNDWLLLSPFPKVVVVVFLLLIVLLCNWRRWQSREVSPRRCLLSTQNLSIGPEPRLVRKLFLPSRDAVSRINEHVQKALQRKEHGHNHGHGPSCSIPWQMPLLCQVHLLNKDKNIVKENRRESQHKGKRIENRLRRDRPDAFSLILVHSIRKGMSLHPLELLSNRPIDKPRAGNANQGRHKDDNEIDKAQDFCLRWISSCTIDTWNDTVWRIRSHIAFSQHEIWIVEFQTQSRCRKAQDHDKGYDVCPRLHERRNLTLSLAIPQLQEKEDTQNSTIQKGPQVKVGKETSPFTRDGIPHGKEQARIGSIGNGLQQRRTGHDNIADGQAKDEAMIEGVEPASSQYNAQNARRAKDGEKRREGSECKAGNIVGRREVVRPPRRILC